MLIREHCCAQRVCCAVSVIFALTVSGCNLVSGYAMNESGMSFYNQGNYTLARREFQHAAADDPYNADYVHNLGMAMKKQGDVVSAEQTYRRALQIDPAHQPSYHSLALLMNEQNRQAEAVDLMEGWVATQSYMPAAHIEMAWLQRQNGDLPGAEQSLQQALEIHANHPVALAHLGQLYQDSGEVHRAVAMYERSLYNDWNQPAVRNQMAQVKKSIQPSRTEPTYARQNGAIFARRNAPQQVFVDGFYTPPQPMIVHRAPVGYPMRGPSAGPGSVAAMPAQFGTPVFNTDPAHVPSLSATIPVIQPY